MLNEVLCKLLCCLGFHTVHDPILRAHDKTSSNEDFHIFLATFCVTIKSVLKQTLIKASCLLVRIQDGDKKNSVAQ